jgi:hypothetical protein
MFAEVPGTIRETPFGDYHYYGGHRLWHAPEAMPRTYFPDTSGVTVQEIPGGIQLHGARDAASLIRKTLIVQLDPEQARVKLLHRLENENPWEVRLAPWAITMFRLGGTVTLPLRAAGAPQAGLLPDRRIVLWPYASLSDPRLSCTDEAIVVNAFPQAPFKIATFNPCGWMTYSLEGVVFKKTFTASAGLEYPDLGSNAEIYCDTEFVELESLGPMLTLAPGEVSTWEEAWEVYPAGQ